MLFRSVSSGPVTTQPGDHALARLVGQEGWSLKLGRDHAPAGLVQIIHVSTGAADHLAAEVSLDFDAQAYLVATYVGEGWANSLTRTSPARGDRMIPARRLLGTSGYSPTPARDQAGIGPHLPLSPH